MLTYRVPGKRLSVAVGFLLFLVASAFVLSPTSQTVLGGEVQNLHGPESAGIATYEGSLRDSGDHLGPVDASSLSQAPSNSNTERVLVDNKIDTYNLSIGESFDDAQGFTTGADYYRLTGVEITIITPSSDADVSLAISEPTNAGNPGTTLYQLDSPSSLSGTVFFEAPENAFLEPSTDYLVRIDVVSGSANFKVTGNTAESDLGLSGWSVADHAWTSEGPLQGIIWNKENAFLYAITVKGSVIPDRFGDDSFTSGYLAFSRYTGVSPKVEAFINDGTDVDWFDSSLSFDYGGRYRIDIEPTALTNDDDIAVRAFYLDNPHLSSGVVELDVESVSDPPEGYLSWHFIAENNFGPYVEVSADNGTTGRYALRIVYDPKRDWTGTEVAHGDLPHDNTTWATIIPNDEEGDQGVYNYYEDHDWFAVELEEDTGYAFLAIAAGAYSHYIHPAIKLYDDLGTELASSYISYEDATTTTVSIVHQVATGEAGTYYVSVTNARLWDDPTKMANVGIDEPLVLYSPFLATRYYVHAATVGNSSMRGLRSLSGNNQEPRVLNLRAISLREGTGLSEHITAYDADSEDSIAGYEVSGGADEELFSINNSGVLSMTTIPDFEVPADANMDNSYEVQVQVTSGSGERGRSVTADFTITVTDDDTEADSVLVSNTGKTVKGNAKVDTADSAVRIYTGPNSDGYGVHSVALAFAEALEDPSGIKVSLWSNHKPGKYARPKEEIFAFTNPSSINARLTEFTAPADTVLEPDTSYWLMIERTGGTALKFQETASDSPDSISVPGWEIGGLRFHRPRSISGQWGYSKVKSDKDQLMLRVIGYERSSE